LRVNLVTSSAASIFSGHRAGISKIRPQTIAKPPNFSRRFRRAAAIAIGSLFSVFLAVI
jgi:hypothetical protein